MNHLFLSMGFLFSTDKNPDFKSGETRIVLAQTASGLPAISAAYFPSIRQN